MKRIALFALFLVAAPAAGQSAFLKNLPPLAQGRVGEGPAYLALRPESHALVEGKGFDAVENSRKSGTKSSSRVEGGRGLIDLTLVFPHSYAMGLSLSEYRRFVESKSPGFELKSSYRQREAALRGSFKILDTHVLGARVGQHRRTRGFGGADAEDEQSREYVLGYLYKSDLANVDLHYTLITLKGDTYVEWSLGLRRLMTADFALSARLIKDPQESCCDVSSARRWEGRVGLEFKGSAWQHELVLRHRPAYDDEADASIPRSYVELRSEALSAPLRYGVDISYGTGKGLIRSEEREFARLEGGLFAAMVF